jgi:hypothetical protein
MVRCESCGAEFQARHPRARFCKPACRVAGWRSRRERGALARWLLEQALQVLRAQGGKTPLLARVEAAVEEAREALAGKGDP